VVNARPRNSSQNAEFRLSSPEARQIALRAQGLWDAIPAKPQLSTISTRLGAVQLDTISVLARSHELVPYARLGAVGRSEIEKHFWNPQKPQHFEYWSHAACIIPIENWSLYSFRRDGARERGLHWRDIPKKTMKFVAQHIEAEGPITTSDVGGGKKTGYWWDWSDNKIVLEHLLTTGEVAVTHRTGFRRVYDVSHRAIPAKHFYDTPHTEAQTTLLRNALTSLGIATKLDLLDVPRFRANQVKDEWEAFVASPDTLHVSVDGWNEPAYVSRRVLKLLDDSTPQRNVMLSPFDSLIWYRERMERLFGMFHRIEAYTPAAKRVFGYFAMPVLVGDKLVARVDPGREVVAKNTVMVAKRVTFESGKPTLREIEGVAEAIKESARWVNASAIRVDQVVPSTAKAKLVSLLQ
jgi:uncharacterized protein YcaQ